MNTKYTVHKHWWWWEIWMLVKRSLKLVVTFLGVLKVKTKTREPQGGFVDSRITRTRSDGSRYVELKDAVKLQMEDGRFQQMKELKIPSSSVDN